MAADPVGQTLAPGGFAESVIGCVQHGVEDRFLLDFTGHRVGNGHCWPRIVDQQFLARRMRLAQADREPADPLSIVGAEAAVTLAFRVLCTPAREGRV